MRVARCNRSTLARCMARILVAAVVFNGVGPAAVTSPVVYADDIIPPPRPPIRTPIVGFIDTHLHQFANLGFGGLEVWGSPVDPTFDPTADDDTAAARALPDSDYMYVTDGMIGGIRAAGRVPVTQTPSAILGNWPKCPNAPGQCWRVTIHGGDGSLDLLNAAIGQSSHGITGYRAEAAPDIGMQWPTWSGVTTQQAYWQWLQRAHDHGLKMITMHAVNNTLLCQLGLGIASFRCDDDSSVVRQIQGAKDLEAYIDARAGGPGQGFYRIVYNSEQARAVIAQGKLAVVLGVEVDTPRNCTTGVDCTAVVNQLVQGYFDMGVRVVYPIHLVDNAFGGAAIYTDLFELNNHVVNGTFFDVTTSCNVGDPPPLTWRSSIRDLLTPEFKLAIGGVVAGLGVALLVGGPVLTLALSLLAPAIAVLTTALPVLGVLVTLATSPSLAKTLFNLLSAMMLQFGPVGVAPAPNCNNRAMTEAGIAVIDALMDHRMLIDVDHTNRLGFDTILGMAEARRYPGIISGHTGLVGAGRDDTDPHDSARHEGNKTDAMVNRIKAVGGFLSLILHQGGRSRIRDLSAPGIAFDCGNSSQAWAQVYLYATRRLGLASVGLGSDMNGFAGMVAPRFGSQKCGGDHDSTYSPTNLIAYGSGLRDYFDQPLRQYRFGNRIWNFNSDGLAHVGLYPDLIADLQAIGLTREDLTPLFGSVEAYVRMWEKVDDNQAPTVTCGTIGEEWHAADESIPCNAYDTGWDLQNPSDASFVLTTSVSDGVETADATTGTHPPVCDAGSNCTSIIPAITGINIDKKAPAIAVTTPAAGIPTYVVNQVVLADFSCTDGGSGLAKCAGTIPTGTPLGTTVGAHAFAVDSMDHVGNTDHVDRPYNVTFNVCLWYDPTNVAKAGNTVPIRIKLCDANGVNTSSAALRLTATGLTHLSTNASGPLNDAGNANPDNIFRYDPGLGGYVLNLKTTGLGTGAWSLVFTVAGDPVPHAVQFRIR